MNSQVAEQETNPDNVYGPMSQHALDLIVELWNRRFFILKAMAIGLLISVTAYFLTKNTYTSDIAIMPPDPQMISPTSTLTALSGGPTLSVGLGGLVSSRTPGSTVIGILSSRVIEDALINRFDLRRVYSIKRYDDARKKLEKQTVFEEDKKSGIVTISVSDHDPVRARDLASAYVQQLDKALGELNSSAARRERVFLEDRLSSLKKEMDDTTSQLSQFSSKNLTMNPQRQGEALFEAAAKLQGELIAAQTELSGLKATYSEDNMRVKAARARINELEGQMKKMSINLPLGPDQNLQAGQIYPSLRELPLLGVKYSDLSRRLLIQQTVFEALTRQFELAKVQEAKELPFARVLDAANIPERKSAPSGVSYFLIGVFTFGLFATSYVVAKALWQMVDQSHPLKLTLRRLTE